MNGYPDAALPIKAQVFSKKPALNTEGRKPTVDGNNGAGDKLRCPGEKPDHGKAVSKKLSDHFFLLQLIDFSVRKAQFAKNFGRLGTDRLGRQTNLRRLPIVADRGD